ncbi:unnamed protein product [Urochloa decumbens]|uniref:Uncharacterized protein n=1 Tax=Urochloa decumbens TaxID=240449 RepID=A0ABC8Y514_9POAL
MSFPPSLEPATKKKKKEKGSASGSRKSARSATDSNLPDPISNESSEQRIAPPTTTKKAKGKKQAGTKLERKEVAKGNANKLVLPVDSPAMGTRSKRSDPGSPAMSTRSKRRLSI